ncbi:hypothetical protein BGX33_004666, partial [Mortierella sp. NVP41]
AVEQLALQLAFLAYPVKPENLLKELDLDPGVIQSIQGLEGIEASGDGNTSDDDEEESGSQSHGLENLSTTLDQTLVSTETMTEKLLDQIQTSVYGASIPLESWPHLLVQPRFESIADNLPPDQLFSLFNSMSRLFSPKSLEILGQADTSRIDLFVVK